MLDTVRRYVEAGRDALTPKKAEDLARALVQQGQARADQAGRLARDLLEWSRASSERLREAIRSEVQKQMQKAGVATKDEVDSLKRRIRELETQARQARAAAKPPAAKASGAKAPARPAAAAAATPSSPSRRPSATATPKAAGTPRRTTSGTRKTQTTGATRIPRGGTATPTSPPGTTRSV